MENIHSVLDDFYESKNVDTLLNMGFGDEERVKKALRYSRNDINEAVSYLTNSSQMDFYEEKSCNVDLCNVGTVALCSAAPAAPPPYESLSSIQSNPPPGSSNNLEFPTAHLYELENRVYPDNWSIPYKRDESLGKCLAGATILANQGLCEASDDCCRFMDQCLPEAFKKLLTSGAVRSWTPDIQEGVFNMLQLLVDLAVARLNYSPVHEKLMGKVLTMALDPQTEFHIKNKHRKYADPGIATTTNSVDPYGWLLSLINRFAQEDGVAKILKHFEFGSLSGNAMTSLLLPLSKCVEFLNVEWAAPLLLPCVQKAKDYISALTENDLKKKDMVSVSELLGVLKCLCTPLWPDQEVEVSGLRLEVILRMLKCPHFNARMNGLKEVVKLIEESSSYTTVSKYFGGIHPDKLQDWLAENKVLSIALEGNIDQAQYADKIKGIIEFAGPRLSVDELNKIWNMQANQNCQVVDNIHAVMAAASTKFNLMQFDHLLSLLQQSWDSGNEQIWKRLLIFAGRIGRDTGQTKHSSKVLELLWDFAHSGQLPPALVEQALNEHLGILGQALHREQTKKAYLLKCLEYIKKGSCVLPSLKFLHNLNQLIFKSGHYKHDKAAIHDINKNHDLIKVVCSSLIRCHKQAVSSTNGEPLTPTILVDGRYCHEEYIEAHLNLLRFVLQEGSQYLPWNRTKEVWDTLVTNPDACNKDRELCFEWFTKCIRDLEYDTQAQLFQNKLLKLEPQQVTLTGFECFKLYFESVNITENKMKKTGQYWTVDKLDLTGLDFLWLMALSSSNDIADRAMEILLDVSYHSLANKLKNDPISLHKKFIGECYKRLEAVVQSVGVTAVSAAVSNATKTLTAISVAEVAALPPPTRTARLQSVHRLLHLAECYVSSIEDLHTSSRAILPHGASFLGYPILLHVMHDPNHEEFLFMAHGNETIHAARQRIVQALQVNLEHVQLYSGETVETKDQKLLRHLNCFEDQGLNFKLSPGAVPTSPFSQAKIRTLHDEEVGSPEPSTACNVSLGAVPIASSSSGHQLFFLEQEKTLPGVVMSSGGQVFEMLYQLANLDDPRITSQVRNLLQLIPTDPNVLDALDTLTAKTPVDVPPMVETRPGSPVKKSTTSAVSKDQKQVTTTGDTPHDILKKLLDSTAQGNTPFRLLYNLEVVSSKLIPTHTGLSVQGGSKSSHLAFCQAFVEAGGLTLLTAILMKESALSQDTEHSLRHGCYYLAMQISRYLLCGQPVCSLNSCLQIRSVPLSFSDEICSEIKSTVVEVDLLPGLARKAAIRLMPSEELIDLIQCLMRLSWASAAGQLHLAVCPLPLKESSSAHNQQSGLNVVGRRSRQSSTGSTASNGSEGDNSQSLHSGLCGQQESVSKPDAQLAAEALAFLVTCLEIRSDQFDAFSRIPSVQDFFIDVLLGSPSERVRESALSQLIRLSSLQSAKLENASDSTVPEQEEVVSLHFLLKALLKVPLPLWVPSSSTRGQNQRLLSQCKQYFKLVCHLLRGLTITEQIAVQIRPQEMIEEETNWLQGFTPSTNPTLQDADNALLVGHLGLIQTLLTCQGVDKAVVGQTLVLHLLNRFLFPASHLISEGIGHNTSVAVQHLSSRGASQEAQLAAYAVLVELATGCSQNLEILVKRLIHMHHRPNPLFAKEYEYEPLIAGRSSCGYVGLKNAGATCYMNSVLQQVYMTPGIKEAVLAVDQNDLDEDSLFSQLQLIFGHLLESHLQYHVPEKFWKCFRLWGEPINVREQQDAFEFFTHLVDQVDEFLKSRGAKSIFGPKYEGLFSDQKICQGCPHRYEREETFMALNLPVKSHNLIDSLDQFVKGELLDGDNAYFCEKCGEKRNTVKRTCIKSLPTMIVIQLKRFGYDWEANRSMKFDDHFTFPLVLDMNPYTASGIQEKESSSVLENAPAGSNKVLYDLVGIVVHSGQATAGHYYSFVKERRNETAFCANKGKWFKFNDTTVEEFDLSDSTLESECYGGTYKAKVTDTENSYPEMRQRYWNAYMLFYEALEEPRTPRTPRKTPTKLNFLRSDSAGRITKKGSPQAQAGATPPLPRPSRDSLSQLTQLVDRGERHGLFVDSVPAHVQRLVQEENLHFINNRDVYNPRYFAFVQQIVTTNNNMYNSPDSSQFMVLALKLSVNFLFNTYLRYKRKSGPKLMEWVDYIEYFISQNKDAADWLINYLASETGKGILKPFLLEFPVREGRQMFSTILQKAINCFFLHGGQSKSKNLDVIVHHLVGMLDKDAADYCRHCTQFFWLLSVYADLGVSACVHLLQKDIFQKCLIFLLGPGASDMESNETYPRHWSSVQSRDFIFLHTLMARLILCCNFQPHQNNNSKVQNNDKEELVPMPKAIQAALYGPGSFRYIQEVVSACREGAGGSSLSLLTEMLVKCSFCNEHFSSILIKQVMLQYSTVPSNELKNLSHLLLELLVLEDDVQRIRLSYAIEGFTDETETPIQGIFTIVKQNQINDSRRSYQAVKFLVTVAHKCCLAKEYLVQYSSVLQWSVNWLKKMIGHGYYMSCGPVSNEDSNTKTFQRTVSAQDTLAEATALLTELESPENATEEAMDLEESPVGGSGEPEYWDSQVFPEVRNSPEKQEQSLNGTKESGSDSVLKRTQGQEHLDTIEGLTPIGPSLPVGVHFADSLKKN